MLHLFKGFHKRRDGVVDASWLKSNIAKHTNLTSLALALNGPGCVYECGVDDLLEIGLGIAQCTSLSSLCLSFNKGITGVGGVLVLIRALAKCCKNLTSLRLDLMDVYITAEGTTELGLAISEFTSLTSITLNSGTSH